VVGPQPYEAAADVLALVAACTAKMELPWLISQNQELNSSMIKGNNQMIIM
jgi:hypothetical protein